MKMRYLQRQNDELRNVEIITGYNPYAEGSCFIKFGNTHVICTASVEEKLPQWLKGQNKGWITAEYGMLPRSTQTRMSRETKQISGRTQEIQRLVGRALRAAVDLTRIKDLSICIDCDVIQADGGTRTASITGGFVALYLAIEKLLKEGKIKINPIKEFVAAVSCGIYEGRKILDVDYIEDSSAQADMNFVLTESGGIVEIQGTAEENPFNEEEYQELFSLAKKGVAELIEKQKQALGLA
jgi:ribonuclease PH